MTKMKSFLAFIFLFAVATGYGQVRTADTTVMPKNWWISLGIGPTTIGAISGSGSCNLEIARRLLLTANVVGETSGIFSTDGGQTSYNLLIGTITRAKFAFLTASAGLGVADIFSSKAQMTSGGFFPVYVNTDRYTVNVPLLVQAYFVTLQRFGLGVSGYVNLNPVHTSAGVNFSIAFGQLATHKKKL